LNVFLILRKIIKKIYASTFTDDKFSPNQFHGFSVVSGLKEQFMMRICGKESKIITPSYYENIDFGITGMNLYQQLDQLCRNEEYKVMDSLGLDKLLVDKILDPINKIGNLTVRNENDKVCTTDYVLPQYISSSIMDNFHYFNSFDKQKNEPQIGDTKVRKEEQFHNNHASHSDSGLMTAVVVTDEPGLEVFDQKLKCWIALEKIFHEYIQKENKEPLSHRKYATIFWGDSHVYLQEKKLHECMHRVATSKSERYSVVFKQRTSPTATAPRYQEDYELGVVQLKSIESFKSK